MLCFESIQAKFFLWKKKKKNSSLIVLKRGCNPVAYSTVMEGGRTGPKLSFTRAAGDARGEVLGGLYKSTNTFHPIGGQAKGKHPICRCSKDHVFITHLRWCIKKIKL